MAIAKKSEASEGEPEAFVRDPIMSLPQNDAVRSQVPSGSLSSGPEDPFPDAYTSVHAVLPRYIGLWSSRRGDRVLN
jgi:hypothetical protein